MVECLLGRHKALSFTPSFTKRMEEKGERGEEAQASERSRSLQLDVRTSTILDQLRPEWYVSPLNLVDQHAVMCKGKLVRHSS